MRLGSRPLDPSVIGRLHDKADGWAAGVVLLLEETPEGFELPAVALRSLPRALRTRVVRASLYKVGARASSEHIEAILDLASGRPGRERHLSGGLLAARGREYVRVSRDRSNG